MNILFFAPCENLQYLHYRSTTTRRPYTWTPYPPSWFPTKSTTNYYPIYVPAITTERPWNNVAVIDAVKKKSSIKGNNILSKDDLNQQYRKRQNETYGYIPSSQIYLKYKRYPPQKDYVIVENNERPVQIFDLVQKNPWFVYVIYIFVLGKHSNLGRMCRCNSTC